MFVYCPAPALRRGGAQARLWDIRIYDFGGIMDWPYAAIDGDETDQAVFRSELPVGVKVVCSKTKAAHPQLVFFLLAFSRRYL